MPVSPYVGTRLAAINNSGQIVGSNPNGQAGFLATPSTPPTLIQMAYASKLVYSGNAAPPGYTYLGDNCGTACSTTGVRAAAYLSADKKYIIIAFRGTVHDHLLSVAMMKHLWQDASFIVGAPSNELRGGDPDSRGVS